MEELNAGTDLLYGGEEDLRRKLQDAKSFIIWSLQNYSPTQRVNIPKWDPPPPDQQERRVRRFVGRRNTEPVTVWDKLTPNLQRDRDIASTAFVAEHVLLEELPSPWNEDRTFFQEAVKKNSKLWFRMPERFRTDPNFILELGAEFQFENDDMIAAVLDSNPQLRENHSIWENIIDDFAVKRKKEEKCLSDWWRNREKDSDPSSVCSLRHAADTILVDRELMIKAFSGASKELKKIHESLEGDLDLWKQILAIKPWGLAFLSADMRDRNPDLVFESLPSLLKDQVWRYSFAGDFATRNLGREFIQTNETVFAEAWFSSGGHFLPDLFPEAWKNDKTIFLAFARYLSEGGSYFLGTRAPELEVFAVMSHHLKADLPFMTQLTELAGDDAFRLASESIKDDYELFVRALSTGSIVTHAFRHAEARGQHWLRAFQVWLAGKIEDFEAFYWDVLPHISNVGTSTSPLRLLSQGTETSFIYKKHLVEYLDVPIGKRLLAYSRALEVVEDRLFYPILHPGEDDQELRPEEENQA